MPQESALVTTTSIPQQPQPKSNMEQPGVLVSMPQGSALVTTTSIPQQPQPKSNMEQPEQHYEPDYQQQTSNTNISTSSGLTNNLTTNNQEKNPVRLINELACYNEIKHQFRVTGEQGPGHKKLFTVTLKLGDAEYEGEGTSIKKAQHSAAAMALQHTSLKHPPPNTNLSMVTPTAELNILAMKRGESPVYVLENGAPTPQAQSALNYHAHYENHYDGQDRYQHRPGELFSIRLRVGEGEYLGMGRTVQAARHDAASKAIEHIKEKEMNENRQCLVVNENALPPTDICNRLNPELESPIRLVHEIAFKRKLNVIFEVLSEKGASHMKVFVTQCRVADLITEGEGNRKQISKERAAEKMLQELEKLEPLPDTHKHVKNNKKQRNYTEQINPISHLIQIQQAKKEQVPAYKVVEERGTPTCPKFVIEATVNGIFSSGTGPNKKIAKWNAAEALLALLGYTNSSATPNTSNPVIKVERVEDPRKVTFMEENQVSAVGGSGECQLVPDLLLANDQAEAFQQVRGQLKSSEMLDSGFGSAPAEVQKTGQVQAANKSRVTHSEGAKDQLLYLAQLLGVQVQFSNFRNTNLHLTVVSLSTTPPQVCQGEGPTAEISHEKAYLEALNVLLELRLDNVTSNKESHARSVHGGSTAK